MVDVVAEGRVVDEATVANLVLLDQGVHLFLVEPKVQGTQAGAELYEKEMLTITDEVYIILDTYSCLSDPAFSEFIEINEEFLDTDSVLCNECLESFLDIQLHVHVLCLLLLS